MVGLPTDRSSAVSLSVGQGGPEIAPGTAGLLGHPVQELFVCLAGSVAEKIWAGEPTEQWTLERYGGDDLVQAFAVLKRLVDHAAVKTAKGRPIARRTAGRLGAAIMRAFNASVVEHLSRPVAWTAVLATSNELAKGGIVWDKQLLALTSHVKRDVTIEELEGLCDTSVRTHQPRRLRQ